MNRNRITARRLFAFTGLAVTWNGVRLALIGALLASGSVSFAALAQAPTATNTPIRLEAAKGTKVSYRVKEQLAGINFPDDAVGSTEAVTGTLVIAPNGSIDSAQSKLTFDLRALRSDQDMRDGYLHGRTLETEKFPYAEFVPRRLQGVPFPLPAPERASGQSGFQLTGDLTIRGVSKELTITGYATFSRELVAGRATTSFTFATFGLQKPQLARLLSVDDNILLEIEFRLARTN
jgi:polyisoprenoid-binding protein YceI